MSEMEDDDVNDIQMKEKCSITEAVDEMEDNEMNEQNEDNSIHPKVCNFACI